MTEVTVPTSHRWIPKGMTVEYLKKAETDLIAIATPVEADYDWDKAGEYLVNVDVYNITKKKSFTPPLPCGFLKEIKKAPNSQGFFILFFKWERIFKNTPNHFTKLFYKASIVVI
jgi:hypothetical protein